jgi:hypothetical protein
MRHCELAGVHNSSLRAILNSVSSKENIIVKLTYEGHCPGWCSHFSKATRVLGSTLGESKKT